MLNLFMFFVVVCFCWGCSKNELSHEAVFGKSSTGSSMTNESPASFNTVNSPPSGEVCLTALDQVIEVYRGVAFPIRKVVLNDGTMVLWNDEHKVNFMKFSLSHPERISILNRNIVANVYWEINCQQNDQPQKIRYDLKAYRCDYMPGTRLPLPIIRRPFPLFPIGNFPIVPIEPVREPENLQVVRFHLFSTLTYQFKAAIPFSLGSTHTGQYVVALYL